MTPDWKALRAEFPALANWTYLNTATYGQMPRSAADAMSRHLARRDELACGDYLAWFDDMDAIRESCARLVHCKAPDIAFVINASTGLAALVLGFHGSPVTRCSHSMTSFRINSMFRQCWRASERDYRRWHGPSSINR
jgi:selenocysteine lyase/cysteine desulfurase